MARERDKLETAHEPVLVQSSNEDDTSTISPYTTRAVTVSIGANGAKYTILQANVEQYSGLKQRILPGGLDAVIELPEVDEDVGHTLIHFIYTGRYQTLESTSTTQEQKTVNEFRRSVLAYCAALTCGIEKLEELTKVKMEDLGNGLSIFEIQHVVEEVSSKLPQRDKWFPEQIQRWTKVKLMADDSLFTTGHLLNIIGRSAVFDKAVVKGLTEMYNEAVIKVKRAVDGGERTLPKQEAVGEPERPAPGIKDPIHTEEAQRNPVKTQAVSSGRYETENSRPNGDIAHDLPAVNVGPQTTENGSGVDKHHWEENLALETPSEPGEGTSPEDQRPNLPEELLEASRRSNGINGESLQVENLKATDSDGDLSKPKASKKSKKAKKRKDSVGVSSL